MATIRREFYFFTNFAFCISITSSLLNLEELHSTKYGLEILSEPVLLKEAPDVTDMLLASKHGQKYQCTLPKVESPQKQKEEAKLFSTEEVAKLLQPVEKKCLYYNNGWWTYELCFGKQISQYHAEGNMVVGDNVSLGNYQSQTDWSKEEVDLHDKPSKSKTKRFHSHFYVNGTECDLTGKPRETQVKFLCEKGSADVIVRVDEPSSCSYIITVLTARLCDNPLFRPPEDHKLHSITCAPALPEHHFNIYLEAAEIKREATEAKKKAIKRAAKVRSKMTDSAHGLGETEEPKTKKKTKKSQLWPWEEPGVESDDELWIDGNIAKDTMGLHRVDITKGRRKDGTHDHHDTITIMSQKKPREKPTWRPKGRVDEASDDSTVQTSQTGSDAAEKPASDEPTTESEEPSSEGTEQSGTEDAQESGKDREALDEMKKDTGQVKLRNGVRQKLQTMGIDPDALEMTIKERLASKKGSHAGETGADEELKGNDKETIDRHMDGLKKAVDDKLDRLTEHVGKMEKEGKLQKNSHEKKLLTSIRQLMEQMDKQNMQLMQKEEALQSLLETQYADTRAQMDKEVELVKNMMKNVEDAEDDRVKHTLETVKMAIERYEETTRDLDADMAAVKQLNSQIFIKAGEMSTRQTEKDPNMRRDFARLASKARQLLKRLLSRSSELDHDMKSLKQAGTEMLKEGATDAGQTEDVDDEAGAEPDLNMEKVFGKVTSMINDLHQTGKPPLKEKERTAKEDEADGDQSKEEDEVEEAPAATVDPNNVRVHVTNVKKDGTSIWSEDDGKELVGDETTDSSVESRIRKATKKMEELMKEHLKNSGISIAGKVRVKIVTSREALENFDDRGGALLSDEETTQFKDMLMGLLGGSQEAGNERKRQMELENNYNLVWDKERLGKVASEDDEDADEWEVVTI